MNISRKQPNRNVHVNISRLHTTLTFILSGCFIESDVTTPANVSVHETPDETDNNPIQLEQITNSSTTGRHVE